MSSTSANKTMSKFLVELIEELDGHGLEITDSNELIESLEASSDWIEKVVAEIREEESNEESDDDWLDDWDE